jgi:multiple sugar transport system substrate-binding protein
MTRNVRLSGRSARVRLAAGIGAGAVIAGAMAGCSGGGSGASGAQVPATAKQTITYSMWDPNIEVAYKEIAAQFEQAHPNITVDINLVPFASYWQKLATEGAAHNAPDIFWTMPAYFMPLVSSGMLLDVAPLIARDHLQLPAMLPALKSSTQVQGKTIGLAQNQDSLAILYNLNQLHQAGVQSVPQPPALTWNPQNGGSLVALAQKLTTDSSGKHPGQPGFNPGSIARYGFVWTNTLDDPYNLAPWLESNGGGIVDKSGHLVIDSPQNVQTITFIKNLSDKWHVSPTYQAIAATTGYSLFSSGRLGMWFADDAELSALQAQAKFPWAVGMNPAGAQGSWTRSNPLLNSIYSGSSHQAAAWMFAKYIESAPVQKLIGTQGREIPVASAGVDSYQASWTAHQVSVKPYITAITAPGANVVTDPVLPGFDQLYDTWISTMTSILAGSISVQSGLAQLQSSAQSITGTK